MRTRSAFVIAAILTITASIPAAAAPYTQLTQTRILESRVYIGPPATPQEAEGDRQEFSALGPFSGSMSYDLERPFSQTGPFGRTEASAAQEVNFGETAIFGSLDMNTHVMYVGGPAGGNANSTWNTTFQVDQETPFTLSGRARSSSFGLGSVGTFTTGFVFYGTSPNNVREDFVLIGISGGNGGVDQPLVASGVFRPGWTYHINATLAGGKSTEGGVGADKRAEGEIDFVLTVPEPGGATVLASVAATFMLRRRRLGRIPVDNV